MKLKDGRRLGKEHLHERRKQSVMLHKKGETQVEIARLLGVHRCTVARWLASWKQGGAKVLKPRRRGVAKGTGRSLAREQEQRIKELSALLNPGKK